MRETITYSLFRTFQQCPRKHQLQYELCLSPEAEPKYFRIGDAVHLGLELLAGGQDAEDVALAIYSRYEELPEWCQTQEDREDWRVEAEIAVRLVMAYAWHWAGTDEGAKCVLVEGKLRAKLVHPVTGKVARVTTVGKVDLIEEVGGKLRLTDHKTSGQDLDRFFEEAGMDPQLLIYADLAWSNGFKVESIHYDLIRKPTIRPRKVTKAERETLWRDGTYHGELFSEYQPKIDGSEWEVPETETPRLFGARLTAHIFEDPHRYFRRIEKPLLVSDVDNARQDLWDVVQSIRDCRRRGSWPRNTQQCTRYGKCPYLDLCASGKVPDPGEEPWGLAVRAHRHPELEE